MEITRTEAMIVGWWMRQKIKRSCSLQDGGIVERVAEGLPIGEGVSVIHTVEDDQFAAVLRLMRGQEE